MITINGVKAQNMQANSQECVKKPTMNEILDRMQANFEQCSNDTSAVQNQQDFSNNAVCVAETLFDKIEMENALLGVYNAIIN